MFGQDNDQQPVQDNNSVLHTAMPDPIADGDLGAGSPASPTFGAPAPSGAPGMPEPTLTSPSSNSTSSAQPVNDDLLNLKQQALQHLSPLVSHLDQTPEEKFRTTMMMIQASDDQTLIKSAFEAAQAITDDKARAQALLDIINEINYFTQHQG